MADQPIELQAMQAVTALGCALCKQPGIDGDQLIRDLSATWQHISGAPLSIVGQSMIGAMESTMKLVKAQKGRH